MLPYPLLPFPTEHVREAGSKAQLLMLSHMLCILSDDAAVDLNLWTNTQLDLRSGSRVSRNCCFLKVCGDVKCWEGMRK